MRVAFICDYSLGYMGGAQSVFLDEVELFTSRGDTVVVIAPQSQRRRRPPASLATVVPVKAIGTVPGAGLPLILNTRGLRRRIRRVLEAQQVDVVHTHSEFGLTAATAAVAHELGIPVVHTVHTFYWQGPNLRWFDRIVAAVVRSGARLIRGRPCRAHPTAERALDSALRAITLAAAEDADGVISPSAHQATELLRAGVREVHVIPNPMRLRATPAAPLVSVDGPLRIVWVGRLAPEKRVLPFIAAVEQAARTLGPSSLDVVVVGDGPQLSAARQAANTAIEAGGCSIRFVGRVDREEVARLIEAAHVLALTSYGFDNQPVVVVEAFNAARSVLYVDARLQEGLAEAGILAEGPDIDGMARTIVALSRDPAVVIERSARTVAAARQFHPDVHAEAVREVWAAAAAKVHNHR